ncbi:hypothetical protein RUM43_011043 [Polyplax serrata]|uniref:ATP-dependent RNA helicase n=1 Tax=Polyplax serrata TaxID=468196 RepID=A0AAN8RTA4_POLSC
MATSKQHVKGMKRKKKFKERIGQRKKKKLDVHNEIKELEEAYKLIDSSKIEKFTDLPLSANTIKGLKETNYLIPTEIQRESIGYALQGEDVLGAAQTGSGKTLAFLIPILEILYAKQWTRLDGVGALIITPTRELAYQIFETLKKVGKYHDFSAGLIIGGKDLHFEKGRMDQCNIVICTPGRILHHMDVNPLFNCTSMQILVLDEADRCLDLGFQQAMNSIIENLPPKRQTLLFSATQTKSVKDLARLSLKNPKYVAVHEHKAHSTPESLEQSYVVCELHEKINIPGSPLLALYGTLHQLRRMRIYNDFCSKQNVVMFATDIAARGLDFPDVNWVVQLDCPEDAKTYIHRAGRTARYRKGGESLLVLLPSEEKAMIENLEAEKIPISKIEINPKKLISPARKIEALVARDSNLKLDAQRAFVAYIKWVYLMKNKSVFNVNSLNLEKFSQSLGLVVTPRVRFLKGKLPTEKSNSTEINEVKLKEALHENESTSESEIEKEVSNNFDVSGDEDEFLTIKRRDHEIEIEPASISEEISSKKKSKLVTKAALAKKMLKKNIVPNKKMIFDDAGEEIMNNFRDKLSKEGREYEMDDTGGIDIEKARMVLKAEDKFDKKLFREKVKGKHKMKKKKMKQESNRGEEEEELKDDFGTDSENDELDDPWIQDPDKIYRQNNSNSEDEKSEGNDNDCDDDDDDVYLDSD